MIPKYRAYHKTWEDMCKVKRIRFNDEVGDEWCLKLVIEDGFEYYCTHLLNKKGNFVNISSMSSFHSYLKGL